MLTDEMLDNYISHLHRKYNHNIEEYALDLSGLGKVLLYDHDLAVNPKTWSTRLDSEPQCPLLQIHEDCRQHPQEDDLGA